MSEDIKVTDGTLLEALNNKVDIDGGNYKGSELEAYIHEHCGGSGLQMFDTILKDYVLTYEESKGLALQGTYVYKDAVAGSREGYPDFYAKCLAEKEEATVTQTTLGESTINLYTNPNGHVFYDIADKEVVDAFFNVMGTAWLYGVDTENERVFLPRNNYFEQVTTNSSEVGQSVEAGLPNITGRAPTQQTTSGFEGAFKVDTSVKSQNNDNTNGEPDYSFTFDASRCSSVYGNSDTVQPNAVKKLLYICVGNTTKATAVSNVIEITTTENDTLPLLHHIAADENLNHPSWLKSGGQWNSGQVYTTVYEYLVNEYTNGTEHTDTLTSPDGTQCAVTYKTINGKKVVDVANEHQVFVAYEAIGSAWYYIIDQDNMQFKLPQSHNYECYTSDPTRLGLDVSAGLPNIIGEVDPFSAHSNASIGVRNATGAFKTLTSGKIMSRAETSSSTNGIGFDASRSNPIYGNSDTVTPPHTEFYLYFKVANAVQNLELLNVGEVLEAVANAAEATSNVSNSLLTITSKIIPDYSAGIIASTNFVAPVDGILHTMMTSGSTTTISINGVKVGQGSTTGNDGETVGVSVAIMGKGDILTLGGRAPSSCKFYPFKGAK